MASAIKDIVSLYWDDIEDSVPLSREKEAELSVLIHQGDKAALDELIEANLRFVVDVAMKFQNRGLSLIELISAGNIGLITAAERFDHTRGFKFITYAVWWIRQAIQTALAEQTTVRQPMNKKNILRRVSKVQDELDQKHGRVLNTEELARELGESAKELGLAFSSSRPALSLDEPFDGEDSKRRLEDVIEDESVVHTDEVLAGRELKDLIAQAIEAIDDERELLIIRLYFGLDGEEPRTLEQIGKVIGVTRERVRQLKERALHKLRSSYGDELEEFNEGPDEREALKAKFLANKGY